MPIYAYKCGSCGHAKDVLQKISDAPLVTCPACSAQAFSKQVTAAGFQLKGSGWYVTDFRGGSSGSGKPSEPSSAGAGGSASSAGTAGSAAAAGAASGDASASSAPAAASSDAPAAAGGCGTSCACH